MKQTYIIGIIIASIIVLGAGSWYWYLQQQTDQAIDPIISYNGYYFAYAEGLWTTQLQRGVFSQQAYFRSSPKDVEDIALEGNLSSFLPANTTYIAFYPKEKMGNVNLALSQIAVTLADAYVLLQDEPFNPIIVCADTSMPECTMPDHTGVPLPIKNCSDASKTILFEEANEAKIIANETCIRLQGPSENIIGVADKMLYVWLGIMEQ